MENTITVNGKQKEFINEFNKSTHVIKTVCTNYNGKQKTFFAFIDATDKGGWFDNFFEDTDNIRCANGGVFGRLETVNANINYLFIEDKSIKERQTKIFNISPFKEVLNFNKQTNHL